MLFTPIHPQYQQHCINQQHQQQLQLLQQQQHVHQPAHHVNHPIISHPLPIITGPYSELMIKKVTKKKKRELSADQHKLNKLIKIGNEAIMKRELSNWNLKCKDRTPLKVDKYYESNSVEKLWNNNISKARYKYKYKHTKIKFIRDRNNNNNDNDTSTHACIRPAAAAAAAAASSSSSLPSINNSNNAGAVSLLKNTTTTTAVAASNNNNNNNATGNASAGTAEDYEFPSPDKDTIMQSYNEYNNDYEDEVNVNVDVEVDVDVEKIETSVTDKEGGDTNIHDIIIEKHGRKELWYKPNKKKDWAEIYIDGKELTGKDRPTIHPITVSASAGCTPRHYTTPDMVEQLDPIIIDKSDNCSPIAKADAVRIKFDETDVENYILFANANSTNLHLRNAYTFYTENKLLLDELVSNLPKDVFHEDDLGGGIYVPFGIGSICQNSKPGKYQRWNKHQVPYTRNETHYMQNYKVFELYGKIMGEIACAIFDIFPSIYIQNQERYHDAEDCCYPTPGMQFSAKNRDKFWFAHQAIIRVIGKPFGEMFGEMLKIALHADESDAPGIQMLSFLPMGGEDGCGGHVEGTDLLVFRDRTGGPCYRLNTTVRDTVVVILFNGKNQLHGGAVDRNCTRELRMENNLFRYYTTRIVHYLRGPAEEFTKARATYSGSDAPVVFVRSSPPSNKKHIPICKETIQYNQLVILPWGKEKKMEKAKLRIENDTMHFFFETGGEFYGNRNVYDPKCISKETCECWWFPG